MPNPTQTPIGLANCTIVDILHLRALEQGDRIAYSFIDDDEIERHVTYQALHLEARAMAGGLRTLTTFGSRVVLLLPSGLDFVSSLFGCLYAGMTAVPAYTLRGVGRQRGLNRLLGMVRDAMPSLLVVDESDMQAIDMLGSQHPELMRIDRISPHDLVRMGGQSELARPDPETLAIIQYTSGSTASPRGVMLTHRNIIANETMIHDRLGYSPTTTFVVWVPLAHDWGLINGVLQPLYTGARAVLMSPQSFVRDPTRWLRTISRHVNVTSGGPNFAYELCLRHSQNEDNLNLASWRWAPISAEPIRPATLDSFVSTFKRSGFRRTAFYPAYGLAEATVMVAGPVPGSRPRVIRVDRRMLEQRRVVIDPPPENPVSALVGVGQPCTGQTVRIVDPDTRTTCPTGTAGEIWVSGSNVSVGYWRDEAGTTAVLQALVDGEDRQRFLRTGDLGFFLDGELFIAGRLKDMIVVRGRNLHPQDIELSVETACNGLCRAAAVAFSVQTSSDEELVIVLEVPRCQQENLHDIVDRIRTHVLNDHGLSASKVVLVARGGIPKTSSGKLQRSACRDAYLAGHLTTLLVHSSEDSSADGDRIGAAGRTSTEATLMAIWSEILMRRELTLTDRFIDVGDSISATQLINRVKDVFGIEVAVVALFSDFETISDLARMIDHAGRRARLGTVSVGSCEKMESQDVSLASLQTNARRS